MRIYHRKLYENYMNIVGPILKNSIIIGDTAFKEETNDIYANLFRLGFKDFICKRN